MTTEPPAITGRLARLEAKLGMPVLLRGVREPDAGFRGRIHQRGGVVVVEYRDDEVGYFWHYDIIVELLELAERGTLDVELQDPELAVG